MDYSYRMLSAGLTIRYDPGVVVHHERQPRARRMTTRWIYGFGMGAFVGKWLRRRDAYAAYIVLVWLRMNLSALVRALLARDWQRAHERWRMTRGTLRGLAYGLTLSDREQ
jgi:hypothetical protein